MALFFDSDWFDAQLAKAGLTRADAAQALGLNDIQLAELWKDQRELRARDVRILAALLAVTPEEVATRAGVSTPIPRPDGRDLETRVTRVEVELAAMRSELNSLKEKFA
jgi:transcriptional regulator with XRE-family HTH domain